MKWMLRLACVALACLLCCGAVFAVGEKDGAEPPLISAECAAVYEPETGTMLFSKDPDRQMLIASTTKIMTAMVVLEHCALDETVNVTPEHASVEGSSMDLHAYHYYTVKDLLYGLMLASGNDAAAALADHCAGSMEAFAALMNEKARALGLENTHFANSHGLDAEGHHSSARDLALITAEALKNPEFRRIFGTASYTVHDTVLYTHNRILNTLPGCIGGKTGFTQAAGRILVTAAEREGMTVIVVTIRDGNDWEDHATLHERAYAAWRLLRLPEAGWARLFTLSGAQEDVPLRCTPGAVLLSREAETSLRVELPRFVFAPVLAGEPVGSVSVYADGELVVEAELCCGESVGRVVPMSAWERFRQRWQ